MVKNINFNDFDDYKLEDRFNFTYFNEEVKYIYAWLFNICEISNNLNLETQEHNTNTLFKNFSELRVNLLRKEKKVTVFGIFKSGKSTLINAILSQKVLPSRTNRATGVITSISYDSQEYAEIFFALQTEKRSKRISIDKINKYILLDTSDVIAKPPENIEKVEIKYPDFFLPQHCCLTDTPGLLDNESLTKLSYEEINKSDLIIIVLRADKLLSEKEREAINYVNKLLKGNVIFVINRMGVVCDDDEEEEEENKRQEEKLLKLANKTLENCGNNFTGKSMIITTDALSLLKNDTSTRGFIYRQGVDSLKLNLRKLFNSFLTERLILLARIGVITHNVEDAINKSQFRLNILTENIINLENLAKKDWEHQKIIFAEELTSIRLNLEKEKNALFSNLNLLVEKTLREAKVLIDDNNTQWAKNVNEEWKKVNTKFVNNLRKRIISTLNNDKINIPNSRHKFIYELNLSSDFGSSVTNYIGGSFALRAIRKIGKTILNSDWRDEHFQEAKKALFEQQVKLIKSLDQYFTDLEQNIKIYEAQHQPVLQTSTELLHHYSDVQIYKKFISDSKQFLEFMIKFTQDIEDWNEQLGTVWQPFAKKIINSFLSEYPQKLKLIKSNLDLNNYINDMIKYHVNIWQIDKEDQAIWLEILVREYPVIGQKFCDILNKMEVNIKSQPVFLWSTKEILAIVTGIFIGIVALLWGQDLGNLDFDLITLRRGMISAGIIYTIFSIVKQIRDKRIEEEVNILIKKLTIQIDSYYKTLESVIKGIKKH